MPRKKSSTKETTKKETTQKKKTAEAPKKPVASTAAKKATAVKATKSAKKATAVKPTSVAKKPVAAKALKATKPVKVSKAAKTTKATKIAKTSSTTKKRKSAHQVEKRKHLRLHYSRLISFIHYDAKNHIDMPSGMAAIQDLSHSGILIETAATFKRGDSLGLDIAFEEDRIIPAQGEVIHLRKTNGMLCKAGIKFTRIKKKDLTYLKGFVDGRLAKA